MCSAELPFQGFVKLERDCRGAYTPSPQGTLPLAIQLPARAALARATGSLIALAAVVGITTGGAYVIGGVARATVEHNQIERLASAAAHGYSESALELAARDPDALAIARRHDPYAAAGTDAADREDRIASFADDLQARRDAAPAPATDPAARLSRVSFTSTAVTAARPFRLRGVLEESRDLECLTQAVYYEARGENAAGQEAVAQVVLNRTRHPSFPKTVCGVVFQGAATGGCQFSFACDGSVHKRVESYAWRRSGQVAAHALDGFVMAEVGNATHFHVASMTTNWGPRLLRVAQIGAHVFYRFGGHNGSGSAFTGTPLPSEPLSAATAQPVYASLALAPLASSVANTVANTVADAAELVISKATGAGKPAEAAAKPAATTAPAAPTTPAATTQPASAPLARGDDSTKIASIS
jgi:spore germination cell wall hydrolase CwlJ-like protein